MPDPINSNTYPIILAELSNTLTKYKGTRNVNGNIKNMHRKVKMVKKVFLFYTPMSIMDSQKTINAGGPNCRMY